MASGLVIKNNMKKYIYIASILCLAINAKSQTRIIVNGDTCVKVTVTVTAIDTITRSVIKSTLAELIEMKAANIEEKRKSVLEYNKKDDYYTAEIIKYRAFKSKTD
jgi:hypothetical protein